MIIVYSHQKGGVGKSTILWNHAVEFSKTRKVYVIDLDIQKTFTQTLQIRNNNILSGTAPKALKKYAGNLELVEVSSKQELIDFLKQVKQDDLVFIDTGGFDSEYNRIAMIASNILITPVSSKFYELLGLKKYESILQDLSSEKGLQRDFKAVVVFNKIQPTAKNILRDIFDFIKKSNKFEYFNTVLRQRVDYENSPALGLSVIEYDPKSKAAKEFQHFKKEFEESL